jgi:hypothetical protein
VTREPGAGALAGAMALVFVVVVIATLLSPLRSISGDTVPGRIGAAALRCGGGFDLASVDWIAARAAAGKLPYWARRTGAPIISVFGPGPALAGALATPALASGDTVDDATLRRRERVTSASLLALAAALLTLAAGARRSPRVAAATGLVAAASFAGAATLGQGLWQQTVALPFVVAALASLAWRPGIPRLALATPALLAIAVLLRPTLAPLALGLGLAWLADRPPWRRFAIAAALAGLAAVPFIAWNLAELGSVLPVAQLEANARVSSHIFVFSRGQLGYGLGGLLISPARGWLWFAPLAVVGTIAAVRAPTRATRLIAAATLLQLLVVAFFHMWWGGICFGPRFLAEATWVALWLALASDARLPRLLIIATAAVTIVVGQLGLWGWRAEQWESRRNPDVDQNALWDPVDSPIIAIVAVDPADQLTALDAPDEPARMQCTAGKLHAAP